MVTSIECSSFRVGFVVQNHYPRSREHSLTTSAHRHSHLFGGLGLMLGYEEFREKRRTERINAVMEELQNLDSQTYEATRGVAWMEGHASCEQDVFRSWLNRTTPMVEPNSSRVPADTN